MQGVSDWMRFAFRELGERPAIALLALLAGFVIGFFVVAAIGGG